MHMPLKRNTQVPSNRSIHPLGSLRRVLCLIVVCSLTFFVPFASIDVPQANAVTSAEKQAEADEIMQRIDALQTQLNEAQAEYERAQADFDAANEAAEKAAARIDEAQERIREVQENLGERAASIYKSTRSNSFLDVLFGAKSFNEFISYIDMADRLADQDAKLVQESKDAKEEAENARLEYEAQQKKAEDEIAAADKAKAEIETAQASLEEELKRVTEEVAMLKAKEEEERMKAEEARKREEEARRLAEEARKNTAAGYVETTNGGFFALPLDSYTVSSEFGWREWSQSFHSGIDLAASMGQPIKASAAGVVSYMGWYGGGGNTVIVNHGNGFRTVYMHMSQFGTSVGKQVAQGEVIGYVGSTGHSTGPHLHFNIEINEEAVNPRYYVQF